MDFILACVLFLSGLVYCVASGYSVALPLGFGLLCFACTAVHRGFAPSAVAKMALGGMKKVLIVLRVFVLIGVLTGTWRACGTIPSLVYYGIAVIDARFFVLFAFLLPCIASMVLGTSFGTAGTVGVVLMVLARSGGVAPEIAAGAVIAGIYFGDRAAPTSSGANLVAALTRTELYDNVRIMLKTAIIPTLLSAAAYLWLSGRHPMQSVDTEVLSEIASGYSLHPATFIPALAVIAMALLRYDVKLAMLVSIASGAAVGFWTQGISPAEMLSCMIWGYAPKGGGRFAQIIAGGGLVSMMGTVFIILLASGYSGIFEGAGLLDGVLSFLKRSTRKWALYPITLVTSLFAGSLGCNQTLTIVLTHQLTQDIYKMRKAADGDLALDLEDTAVLIAALIPWNIAVATPLAILGASPASIPYAFFLYFLPACRLFTRRPAPPSR